MGDRASGLVQDVGKRVQVREQRVADIQRSSKCGLVVWTTPQKRKTRNAVHLVHAHDGKEHGVLVLAHENGGIGRRHVARDVRLPPQAKLQRPMVAAVLVIARPRHGGERLHARLERTVDGEEAGVGPCCCKLGALCRVPVQIREPLRLPLVVPPEIYTVGDEVEMNFRVPVRFRL